MSLLAAINPQPEPTPLEATHLDLWAKWGDDGSLRYPLIGHLIDTALVMEWLWDNWMPEGVRNRYASQIGVSQEHLKALMVSAAARHDLGKATPCFQGQLLGDKERFHEFKEWLEKHGLLTSGKAMNALLPEDNARLLRRHEVLSEFFTRENPLMAWLVGGHHGRWWSALGDAGQGFLRQYLDLFDESENWGQVIDELREDLNALFPSPAAPQTDQVHLVPVLTGVLCVADWLVSAERSIALGQQYRDLLTHRQYEDFIAVRREWLHGFVRGTLGLLQRPSGSFEEIFAVSSRRPVQQALLESRGGGLRIVMVPPGDGKTEAALGYWLANTAGDTGLYFALPTMATSDAMFRRVNEVFERSGVSTAGALIHGYAALNTFYQAPAKGGEDLEFENLDPSEAHRPTGRDLNAGLTPAEWFRGRHRALLTPVAVGTVDQLLMGVLRTKYNFLRLAGVVGKTVVLDEVHSYDPYMAALLEKFLRWAGLLGIDVILLSATLPRERVEAYCKAYGNVAPPTDWKYPAVVVVRTSSGDNQSAGPAAVESINLVSSGRMRGHQVEFDYHQVDGSAADAAHVVRSLRSGYPDAKIGVIVNTVGRAQQLAMELREAIPDLLVVHSRLPAGVRQDRMLEAERRFGKESQTGGEVLIATQVVEQSVDLDFDILVTDLCPSPSLVQRVGRLWRHDLTDRSRRRPEGLQPVCHVLHGDMAGKAFPYLPYTRSEIRKTWEQALAAGKRRTLTFPDEIQDFVDAGHLSLHDLLDDGSLQQEELEGDLAKIFADRQTANLVTVPDRIASRADLERFSDGEFSEQVATRLRDVYQLTVIPYAAAAKHLPDESAAPVPLPRDTVLELMAAAISVSGKAATAAKNASEQQGWGVGARWWTNGPLKDVFIADFDETGTFQLDESVGLVYQPRDD